MLKHKPIVEIKLKKDSQEYVINEEFKGNY